MKKSLFTLFVVISFSTISFAQTKNTNKKAPQTEEVTKKAEKATDKPAEKDNSCLLTDNDEVRNMAEGKITHPSSIPRVKKEISMLTTCAVANIKIISGGDAGNTAEYIACVCGTKMVYKADYFTKIKTITEL